VFLVLYLSLYYYQGDQGIPTKTNCDDSAADNDKLIFWKVCHHKITWPGCVWCSWAFRTVMARKPRSQGGNDGYIDGHSTSHAKPFMLYHRLRLICCCCCCCYNTIFNFLLMSPSLSHPLSHPLCSLLTMLWPWPCRFYFYQQRLLATAITAGWYCHSAIFKIFTCWNVSNFFPLTLPSLNPPPLSPN